MSPSGTTSGLSFRYSLGGSGGVAMPLGIDVGRSRTDTVGASEMLECKQGRYRKTGKLCPPEVSRNIHTEFSCLEVSFWRCFGSYIHSETVVTRK